MEWGGPGPDPLQPPRVAAVPCRAPHCGRCAEPAPWPGPGLPLCLPAEGFPLPPASVREPGFPSRPPARVLLRRPPSARNKSQGEAY